MSYWIYDFGQNLGPYPPEEIVRRAAPGTLVSHGSTWVRFEEHPDFHHPATDVDYWILEQNQPRGPYSRAQVACLSNEATIVSCGDEWVPFRSHPHFSDTRKPGHGHVGTPSFVSVNSFRVPKEQASLAISLAISVLGLFVLTTISLGVALVFVAVAVVLVKILQGNLLGSSVRVSAAQFPRINELVTRAASRLGMAPPQVFVRQDPAINAFAVGFLDRGSVVLNSATIENLTDDELLSIIGHEFGHVKCGHTTWSTLAGGVPGVDIPIFSLIVGAVFKGWSRKAEYSADRASLLATRDLRPTISALLKLSVGGRLVSEVDIESFLYQKAELDGDDVTRFTELGSTHPYTVNRIHALQEFRQSPIYAQLNMQP